MKGKTVDTLVVSAGAVLGAVLGWTLIGPVAAFAFFGLCVGAMIGSSITMVLPLEYGSEA